MTRRRLAAGLNSHDRGLFILNGWIRDPYIVFGPDQHYYLTGTTPLTDDPREKSEPYNTGLGEGSIVGWKANVWRSRNLIEWETLNAPFSLKDGIWFTAKPSTSRAGQWRLWARNCTGWRSMGAGSHQPGTGQGSKPLADQGMKVAGPWTNPMGEAIQRRHDPSLFKDDDGTWWMIWGATSIAPLKANLGGFKGKPVNGPAGATAKMGHEGCLIQKILGKYVLFGTGWSTGKMRRGSYNLYYASPTRSPDLTASESSSDAFWDTEHRSDRRGDWWLPLSTMPTSRH